MINIDYRLLNLDKNLEYINDSCLVIFIKLDLHRYLDESVKDNKTVGNKAIDIDLFNDRNQLCERNADIVINCADYNIDKLVDCIIVEILKYFD